ncbi:Imm1 family immunity protein [Streptoalloteichus tenebrarius]|uniref:Imm1 family immunity protein n=1 Tax=Streptoalloteichus tenebrarius (strain ATCC 17920 / DSM 40477 / JCM 4838 / CBS 697.72 / NBRC 16177 / NCIMB 11028 / NRRL B-12390 / A12253. 1 / ISP 5477) TaxID=1933 RepID=UPI0020A2588C|nr:Imm1 family immunity protein [Streptoalloteichus tenebrarius]
MTYTIEAFYANPRGVSPVLLSTPDELDQLVDDLFSGVPAGHPGGDVARRADHDALLYLAGGGMGMPDHELRVVVDRSGRVGALSFVADATDVGGTWFSRSTLRLVEPPTLYADCGSLLRFPTNSILALPDVREALHEFQRTGARPTCVDWQPAAGYLVAAARDALTWLPTTA